MGLRVRQGTRAAPPHSWNQPVTCTGPRRDPFLVTAAVTLAACVGERPFRLLLAVGRRVRHGHSRFANELIGLLEQIHPH
jgi:hypothetical protein